MLAGALDLTEAIKESTKKHWHTDLEQQLFEFRSDNRETPPKTQVASFQDS
jgi:hypothetical protein